MKKFIIVIFSALISMGCVFAGINSQNDITGRWAEKISERVVMDIYSDKNNKDYQIFITWREDNLAQKDIYRFKANPDKNGDLKYKDGIHLIRYYDDKNNYRDEIDYTDASGLIKFNNNELIWIDNKDNSKTDFIRANKSLLKDTTVKNKLFAITLPEELKNFYEVTKQKDKTSFYHKASKNAGFGGFAFGIKAYKNPADHANLPGGTKIGELTDKKGVLYDVVLKYPTDVQYDYTKTSEPSETYKLLYELGDVITVKGVNGSTYYKNQGMKGEDLYKEILKKHVTAIQEKWDSTKLEEENMSYMYNVIFAENKNPLEKIGYIFYDANGDGIDELLIGEIADGAWKGVIYDIYTMADRKPKHVVSGGSRNRYYVCNGSFICNEYSSGAMESGVRVYILLENSDELFHQVSFKYDGYVNSQKPWFMSYGSGVEEDKWENVSEKTFSERKKVFDNYKRFDFIPLSQVKL